MKSKINIQKPTGIILSGGKNSRMGREKALLKLNDRSLFEIALSILSPICSEIIISTNKNIQSDKNFRIVPDEISNIGPMGGIYSCLKHSSAQKNYVISIDSPFINSSLLKYLFDQSGEHIVTIPEYNGKKHPLIGVYEKGFINILENEIASKYYKMLLAINKTSHKIVEITENLSFFNKNLFTNINTPQDYKNALKTLM